MYKRQVMTGPVLSQWGSVMEHLPRKILKLVGMSRADVEDCFLGGSVGDGSAKDGAVFGIDGVLA